MVEEMDKKHFYMFDLNILRGIGILGVLIIHTDQMLTGISRWLDMLSETGQMGCEIFFILSGFGLCYSWQKTEGNFFWRYKGFLKSRWLKIGLPYCFTLALLLGYIWIVSAMGIDSVIARPVELPGVISLFFLVNGVIPKYHNYLFLGSWYMGTLAVLYVIFPFVYEAALRSFLNRLKITGWIFAAVPVFFSLFDYCFLGAEKHLINSYWYFSAWNQFPCFFIGILLYFEFERNGERRKCGRAECAAKAFLWLLVFAFFFWLRESLLLSAAIVCTAFGRAVYWIFIFCANYLGTINKRWKAAGLLSGILGKYGEVSYYAFLIHSFLVRDLLHWLLAFSDAEGDLAYVLSLALMIVLVYWTAKAWKRIVKKLAAFC